VQYGLFGGQDVGGAVRVRHMCAALVILPLLEASWHRCILEVI